MARPLRVTARPGLASLAPPHVVDGGERLSSSEAAGRIGRLAGGLAAHGVARGDVVAFQLPNWWESIALFHACWHLGAVPAPLHHRGGGRDVTDLLDRLSARLVLAEADSDLAGQHDVIPVRHRGQFTALQNLPAPPATEPAPDDVAVLLATSGSTGAPKIVRHTHGALAGKARDMMAAHGLSSDDTILMPAPLAHISGLLNGILIPATTGMTVVLMERWDPADAIELIAREHVTFMIGPPTFFVDIAAEPACTHENVASLRLVSTGGATVTPAFVRDSAERLGATVKRTYGSTEAPTVTTWHAGDPPDKAATTDGRPVGDTEVRVVDAAGRVLGPGEVGELHVRGPDVFAGYDDPAATAAALDADGWFATGDLARISEDGWVTIVGRVRNTIIRGGENISPVEVETVCATLPGVRQAVAVGMHDERLGQRVALVVEADDAPTLEQVRAHCRSAGLATFKTPEDVVAVPRLPRLAAGKPDRAALEELVAAGRREGADD